MWRLFYPLRYFKLLNSEKRRMDFWPTIILAAIIALPFIILPGASFFKTNGFLDKLLLVMSALSGFYVAALVAAATFNHDDLDRVMTFGSVSVIKKSPEGEKIAEPLTRREFVCTIFGYLAFATFVFTLLSSLFVSLSGIDIGLLAKDKWFGFLFTEHHFIYLRDIILFVFSLIISHIAVVTALGIYYFMDRLHRHDQRIITKKHRDDAA